GGELAVADRVRGGEGERAVSRVVFQQEPDGADLVGERDPAHHLAAVAQPRQQPQPPGQRQPRQDPPPGAEPKAAAQGRGAEAGAGGASQWCGSGARNSSRGGVSSVTSRPPVAPYQPMADPLIRVAGAGSSLVSAVARARVASTRLALISAL